MELDVGNPFIRKIITIQECRCIMRDMNMFRCGDMMILNVADCDKSLVSYNIYAIYIIHTSLET
jgi:hypothetical protein